MLAVADAPTWMTINVIVLDVVVGLLVLVGVPWRR